jgi:hypothetical protein
VAQPSLLLHSQIDNEIGLFGQFTGNYYASPLGDQSLADIYLPENGARVNRSYSLTGWQGAYGKDLNSRTSPILYPAGTDLNSRIRFEDNATIAPRQVVLDASYTDAKGTTHSGTVTLQPYTSMVLMK